MRLSRLYVAKISLRTLPPNTAYPMETGPHLPDEQRPRRRNSPSLTLDSTAALRSNQDSLNEWVMFCTGISAHVGKVHCFYDVLLDRPKLGGGPDAKSTIHSLKWLESAYGPDFVSISNVVEEPGQEVVWNDP